MFSEMHSPYMGLAWTAIRNIREQVGDQQFNAWLNEDFGTHVQEIQAKLVADSYTNQVSG